MRNNLLQSCFRVSAIAILFTSTAICASKTDFVKNYKGTPYQDSHYQGGAQKIPGIVQCAYYDFGGEGVAYHDADTTNSGGQYRTAEGVDIAVLTDPSEAELLKVLI